MTEARAPLPALGTAARQGKIVAIANQKGGVGKTTTSVNLAATLAAAEKKVLLIDVDAQANASSGLGVGAQDIDHSIYAALEGTKALPSLVRKTALRSLDLVPAGPDLYGADMALAAEADPYLRLKTALESVRARYDFILIDCPPSLGLLTLNALCAADSVMIPMQCEYYALEGLSQLMTTIEMVRGSLNPSLKVEGVLLTMFDSRNNLAKEVAENVRANFGEKVYTSVIPRNVRLSEAPSFGKPIILYDIKSRGCQSYMDLAEEFMRAPAPATISAA